MHTKPMSELEGEFNNPMSTDAKCPKCGKQTVSLRIWESHCGGYEDERYTCASCGHYWWVEGPDA